MTSKPKILIVGHKRHGKDSVAEILEENGFRCLLSSTFALTHVMMPYFASIGKPYPNTELCFADRVHHRTTWYDEIERYNAPTYRRMTEEAFAEGYDVYVGMRSPKEFAASRGLYDHVFWVDASKRLPPENASSNGISAEDADMVIDNNGTLADLVDEVKRIITNVIPYSRMCPSCEGSGWNVYDGNTGRDCSVCSGRGKITQELHAELAK